MLHNLCYNEICMIMKHENYPYNPFLLSGYVSPEYFCDRVEETQKLISALRNGRNVTLISPRRMGNPKRKGWQLLLCGPVPNR